MSSWTIATSLPPYENIRQKRDLMVVLPVLQGRNINKDKLQYLYTKAPVTVIIKNSNPTTHRPYSANSWPASVASKAQVFLVEPSIRRTSTYHTYYPGWVRHTIPSTSTQRPNYSAVLRLGKIVGKSTERPMKSHSNDKFHISVSKVTWRKSSEQSAAKYLSSNIDETSESAPAKSNVDAANFQFNSSVENVPKPDEETVARLASNLQTSTDKLSNDIKLMLLYLALLTEGTKPHEDSNELWSEGLEKKGN